MSVIVVVTRVAMILLIFLREIILLWKFSISCTFTVGSDQKEEISRTINMTKTEVIFEEVNNLM